MRIVWASAYRAGAITSDEEFTLIEDRFLAGGANTVRGFAQDALGPRTPITNQPIGGEAVAIFNQEIRFPIYRQLHGGVFLDTGNVFPRPEDVSFDDLRWSTGFGVRYELPFGVVRLDYGIVLDRMEGESANRLHLIFGQAF